MKDEFDGDFSKEQEKVSKYMETKDWKNAQAQHWDINRAKQGVVFDANQMYIRKFPDNAASYMDKIKPDKWGLENSVKKLTQQATEEITPYTGTAQEWWDKNKTVIDGKEYLVIKDYNGREWKMNKKEFDAHTSNAVKKREFRTKYLDAISEVISKPNEVWLSRDIDAKKQNNKRLNNWFMVKYYKGIPLVIRCQLVNGELKFKSWFELRDRAVRSGILIKK